MINKPTSDFVSTTFDVALAQGESGSITAKLGTGLSIPATNSFIQVDYNSTAAVGDPDGPETIFYATYNSGTGALTGVVRAQAGTTDVAHSAGAEVQCGMTTAFLEDNTGWKTVKDTWTYASASTITVPSGAASTYCVGDYLKFVQSGVTKYAWVVGVADTVLTVVVGLVDTTVSSVANAAITSPYFSHQRPVGFPGTITWSGTEGGWSGTPTQANRYAINGRMVTMYVSCDGTSDNATTTLTLPVASAYAMNFGSFRFTDNGTSVATGMMVLTAASATATFYKDAGGGGFTASGAKKVEVMFNYFI